MSKWKTVKDNVSKLAWEHKHPPPPWMKEKESPSSSLYTHPTTCKNDLKIVEKKNTSKVDQLNVSKTTSNREQTQPASRHSMPENINDEKGLKSEKVNNSSNLPKENDIDNPKKNVPRHSMISGNFIQTPLIAKIELKGNIEQKKTVDLTKRDQGLNIQKRSQKRGEEITTPPWVKNTKRVDINEAMNTQAVDTMKFETVTVVDKETPIKTMETISTASPFSPEKERLEYFRNYCGTDEGHLRVGSSSSSSPGRNRVANLSEVDCLYCLTNIQDPVELVSQCSCNL